MPAWQSQLALAVLGTQGEGSGFSSPCLSRWSTNNPRDFC